MEGRGKEDDKFRGKGRTNDLSAARDVGGGRPSEDFGAGLRQLAFRLGQRGNQGLVRSEQLQQLTEDRGEQSQCQLSSSFLSADGRKGNSLQRPQLLLHVVPMDYHRSLTRVAERIGPSSCG